MDRQRTTDSALTITMADIGGEPALRETLQEFYKREIRELPTWRHRRAVRRLCEEHLISLEGRRLSIENHEIHRRLKLPEEILRKLVDRRLLRAEQRADSTYYELSHDTLVEPVLATRRVRARALGILNMVGGGLVLLIAIYPLWESISSAIVNWPIYYEKWGLGIACIRCILLDLIFTLFIITVIIAGTLLFHRGVLKTSRYLSHE